MNFSNFKISVSDSDISAISALSDSDRSNLVTTINSTDPQLLFDFVEGKEGKQIICPICGSGSGKHHTGANISFENGVWLYHCFACDSFKGDLIKIIAHFNNLSTYGNDFFHVLAIAAKILNLNIPSFPESSVSKKSTEKISSSNSISHFQRLTESRNNLKNFVESQGGNWRGLSLETLQRLNWGFLPNFNHPKNNLFFPAVIIPNDLNGIFARRIDDKGYSNIEPTYTTTIFLPDSDEFDLIVTEGAINAASILQAIPNPSFGIIASGGTSGNKNVLDKLQQLKNNGKKFRVLIAYDNDTSNAGQKAADKLLKMLLDESFSACSIDITKTPDSDINDLLLSPNGESKLISAIHNAISTAKLTLDKIEHDDHIALFGENSTSYFSEQFQDYVDENKKYEGRKTGFDNLDAEIKSFKPGIYVLGGLPALGKTTFALQLLDQMANNGDTCFFCSYEMEKGFLYSKLLAREVYKIESNHFSINIPSPLSSINISQGKIFEHGKAYREALKNFTNFQRSLYIWELDEINIDSLLARLDKICDKLEKPPIVAIDYLQLLAGNSFNTKSALDDVLHKIFSFRRRTNTTFIIISSLNRMNYNTQISFEAFKETGNIEYSADVIWGLQLDLPKRDPAIIDAAKKEIPRKIQLKCLKNRFGSNFDVGFLYFPNFDTFKPNLEYGSYTEYRQNSDGQLIEYENC